jgi:hypothetical protein
MLVVVVGGWYWRGCVGCWGGGGRVGCKAGATAIQPQQLPRIVAIHYTRNQRALLIDLNSELLKLRVARATWLSPCRKVALGFSLSYSGCTVYGKNSSPRGGGKGWISVYRYAFFFGGGGGCKDGKDGRRKFEEPGKIVSNVCKKVEEKTK